jgi:hypothetical protein
MQGRRLVFPEILEPIGRQSGVSDGGHDRAVAEVGLHDASVVAVVGELEPAGVLVGPSPRHLSGTAGAHDRWLREVMAETMRYRVEPRDIPPECAARRLGLNYPEEFEKKLPCAAKLYPRRTRQGGQEDAHLGLRSRW